MKIIKPSHQHMKHDGLTPQQFIEIVGRTCYKSTDKITDDSAEKFVDNLIKRKHWAMLEHETVYVRLRTVDIQRMNMEISTISGQKSKCNTKFLNITYNDGNDKGIISGSIRSFYDVFKNALPSLIVINSIANKLWCAYPWAYKNFNYYIYENINTNVELLSRDEFIKEYQNNDDVLFKHLTHTVKFICDRGVSHELVRHRPCSFAQESTRYCNYSQEKFGKEITVILPCFFDTGMGTATNSLVYDTWKRACEYAEESYFKLLDEYGATPQEARDVLPNSLKTEIIMTATEEEWQHIVNLRAKGTTGQPHPQMVEIMEPWYEELKEITNNRVN